MATETHTTSIIVDIPNNASGTVEFRIGALGVNGASEIVPQKSIYTFTLDANGEVTDDIATPDGDGSSSWSWIVTSITAAGVRTTLGTVTIFWDASAQELGALLSSTSSASAVYANVTIAQQTWLAAALSANDPAANWVEAAGDTMSGQLNFSGKTHAGIKLLSLTTTERDALTPAEGMVIYNETDSEVQAYQGAAWVAVGSGAGANPALNDVTDVTITTPADNEVLAYNGAGEWINQTAAEAGLLANIVEDTTPQLGGNLDLNGNVITGLEIGTDVQAYDADTAKLDAAQTWSAAQTLADNEIIRPKLKDYGETVNALGSIGGGTQDIDLESGNVVSGTVDTSTTTFTFSNPPASGTAGSFTLFLTNGGSQTVNWPASVDWAGGTAPTLTTSGVDILTFTTIDGGTIWYGFSAGLDMQ